ncbi:MAG: protein-export chaperone SecB [Mariprofundaceae bacterium]|nr:protein-export chaperone SecB [Mariprofundaceae bacterium]
MSEQTNSSADTPIFQVKKMYIKDISFENPNAPQVFMDSQENLNIAMNLGLSNNKLDDDHWEVTMKTSIIAQDKANEKLVFEVEVEYAGLFLIQNIPEEAISGLIGVDCPGILQPYVRQIISQLTVDGGFMPFLMEPVNFRAAYEQNLANNAKEEEKPTLQ